MPGRTAKRKRADRRQCAGLMGGARGCRAAASPEQAHRAPRSAGPKSTGGGFSPVSWQPCESWSRFFALGAACSEQPGMRPVGGPRATGCADRAARWLAARAGRVLVAPGRGRRAQGAASTRVRAEGGGNGRAAHRRFPLTSARWAGLGLGRSGRGGGRVGRLWSRLFATATGAAASGAGPDRRRPAVEGGDVYVTSAVGVGTSWVGNEIIPRACPSSTFGRASPWGASTRLRRRFRYDLPPNLVHVEEALLDCRHAAVFFFFPGEIFRAIADRGTSSGEPPAEAHMKGSAHAEGLVLLQRGASVFAGARRRARKTKAARRPACARAPAERASRSANSCRERRGPLGGGSAASTTDALRFELVPSDLFEERGSKNSAKLPQVVLRRRSRARSRFARTRNRRSEMPFRRAEGATPAARVEQAWVSKRRPGASRKRPTCREQTISAMAGDFRCAGQGASPRGDVRDSAGFFSRAFLTPDWGGAGHQVGRSRDGEQGRRQVVGGSRRRSAGGRRPGKIFFRPKNVSSGPGP